MPNCSATRAIAPCFVAGSCLNSTAMRVARSRNSSGYFLGAAMTLILHGLRASIRPGAIQKTVEDWAEIRRLHVQEQMSIRAIARHLGSRA
ncbi:hypothetical protein I601_1765 [Nocardioides dokdonensis FR1436]|uniref:Transposase IS30-like HTH domain-containing protein n=1 Tax=Nocardioides dokdonensis FR1436 TaxID=1300347 RepID=A0A1A9GJF4_9ACTN|nr:hypothetical protein I601_1765 [Nocardioides dokdonensis FR1436]